MKRILPFCLFLFVLQGCLAPPPPAVDILDLRQMPQDPRPYLDPKTADLPLWNDQERLASDYLERHFAPWQKSLPRPAEEAYWFVSWLEGKSVYGENLLPVEPGRIEGLIAFSDRENYPSLDLPAITVRPTDARALPSRRPIFLDPSRAGQGFPFDYLQNSAVSANTPLRLRHRTPDGSWVYGETAAFSGWFPAEDVAMVDPPFIETFRHQTMAVAVRDSAVVIDAAGAFRYASRTGTLFPLIEKDRLGMRVLAAAAGPDGRATAREAFLLEGDAAPFPLEGTARRVAEQASRKMGQTYAWGDQFGDRDCSSAMRDLFAPFGLWLPRNSARQARAGLFVPLEELSPEGREEALLRDGLPWRTLVWMSGHIMLYVGEYQGQAAVLHALWGVRTRDDQGRDGRRIVGRTVITTLQPGIELPDLARPEGDLRGRVRGMTHLALPAAAAGP